MRRYVLPLLALCLAGCAASSFADGPAGPDVLGIGLDSTIDDATAALRQAVPDATLAENTGTLTLGDFTSPTLRYGANVAEGNLDPLPPAEPLVPENGMNKEYLTFLYGLDEPQRVIGIYRHQQFTPDQSPTVAAFHDGLIQKYGRPLSDDGTSMRWLIGARGRQDPVFCENAGDQEFPGMAQGQYGFQMQPFFGKCGVYISALLSPQDANPKLLFGITFTMMDMPAMKASYDYIYKVLNAGAATKSRQDTQNAARPAL